MRYFIIYLIIGVAISFIYDLLQTYIIKREELRFNNWERIALILLWPFLMAHSSYQMIKNRFKDE
jgi:hypothetical protein